MKSPGQGSLSPSWNEDWKASRRPGLVFCMPMKAIAEVVSLWGPYRKGLQRPGLVFCMPMKAIAKVVSLFGPYPCHACMTTSYNPVFSLPLNPQFSFLRNKDYSVWPKQEGWFVFGTQGSSYLSFRVGWKASDEGSSCCQKLSGDQWLLFPSLTITSVDIQW